MKMLEEAVEVLMVVRIHDICLELPDRCRVGATDILCQGGHRRGHEEGEEDGSLFHWSPPDTDICRHTATLALVSRTVRVL
jgi:hypothetical protein